MNKLFLDDTRDCPTTGGYNCAINASMAKTLLRLMPFDFITLDYSLGRGEETGLDVLIWMKENNIFVPHINIHSDHSVGKEEMRAYCQENFPNSTVTMNPISHSTKK